METLTRTIGSLVLERWRPSKQSHPNAVVFTTPNVGEIRLDGGTYQDKGSL